MSLSVPRTIERSSEPIVVEDNSDNEDESPPRETPINEYEKEQSNSHNDVVVSPKRFVKDNSPLPAQSEHEARFDSPLNDEDSLAETLKVAKQSIKILKQHKANRLKDIEEAHDRLKIELQQQQNELLMWVDRWQQMKSKKDKYKAEKKLLATTNEKLLKDERVYEEKILKLRAKLSEARKEVKLQIATTQSIFSYFNFDFDREKCFNQHTCKIVDFTGMLTIRIMFSVIMILMRN